MLQLSPLEARVIGCLLEKEITTPDQYPLSINALVNACNQKSNRHPVLELTEGVVQGTLDDLAKKRLVMERSGFGSRVPKYQHRFCNSEFGELQFTPPQLAVVCELLLRGPQTPGELRANTHRLHAFQDVTEVEAVLQVLTERADGPFVVRLGREPGKREARFASCFLPEATQAEAAQIDHTAGDHSYPTTASGLHAGHAMDQARIEALEQRVEALAAELAELKQQLGAA